mgnify:FL=1
MKNKKCKEGLKVPKTKFQNFIFTFMTVILMTYCMIVYNIAINSSDGLINQTFLIALKEFPKNNNKMFITLSIQTFTVLIMVGLMSIYVLFTQHLINSNVICNYIILYCKNFIMAYPLQIFFVGPFVRNVFRIIFRNN